MGDNSLICIDSVIAYIEENLNGNLDLGTVADAVHYSKYHLHRVFSETVGMTLHDYANRRQLTEAAKLLVFSDKPIIEIASICGYESPQSFTSAFKAMYKTAPAQYRDKGCFYPLQLRFTLHQKQSAEKIHSPSNPAGSFFRYSRMDGSDASGNRRLPSHERNGVS